MNTAQVLLNTFNETRSLSLFYFHKLDSTQCERVIEYEGIRLNSPRWIMAHLAWAEQFLLLKAMGMEELPMEWLNKVAIGKPVCNPEELPAMDETLACLNQIHTAVNHYLPGLSDAQLEEKNAAGLKFGPNESKRFMFMHAIRHEGTHAGQLGWLCKLNTIKTV